MFEVGEEEAAAEVYEFNAADVADISDVVFSLCSKEDVLGLQVGVHDVVAVYQVQGLAYLQHQDLQLVLILLDPVYQLLVDDLNKAESTR